MTLNFMKWHNYEEKDKLKLYFNFGYYNDLELSHRVISSEANRDLYGLRNDIFFKVQEDFMTYKNFDFLKDKERYNNLIKLNLEKEEIL